MESNNKTKLLKLVRSCKIKDDEVKELKKDWKRWSKKYN